MESKPKLVDYKKKITKPLKKATLCFLFKDDQILIAMKKEDLRWVSGMESEEK